MSIVNVATSNKPPTVSTIMYVQPQPKPSHLIPDCKRPFGPYSFLYNLDQYLEFSSLTGYFSCKPGLSLNHRLSTPSSFLHCALGGPSVSSPSR